MVERCPDKTEVEGPIPSTRTVNKLNIDKEISWLLRDKYNGVESADFARDVLRLKSGEPLAYVIGWVPFLDTKIYLDSHPLIPRPETEYWVKIAINELQNRGLKNQKVLDLCAGSGCIGVAVAKAIPNAEVHFAEIDSSHHNTIRKNILENGIDENRAQIFGGDLFEHAEKNYDMILTNPPYIATDLAARVAENVLAHEPEKALWAGEDGMNLIKKIIELAPEYLNKNGVLYLEHEPEQVEKIKALDSRIESFPDQFGVMRFSRLQMD